MNPFLAKARTYLGNVKNDFNTLAKESTGVKDFIGKTWDASTQGRARDLIHQYSGGGSPVTGKPGRPLGNPFSLNGMRSKSLVDSILKSKNPQEEMAKNFGLHAGWKLHQAEEMKKRVRPIVLGTLSAGATGGVLAKQQFDAHQRQKRQDAFVKQYLGY